MGITSPQDAPQDPKLDPKQALGPPDEHYAPQTHPNRAFQPPDRTLRPPPAPPAPTSMRSSVVLLPLSALPLCPRQLPASDRAP